MPKLLTDEVHARIIALCAEGDEEVERQHFDDAMALYQQAWDLLPVPKYDWDAATWILCAIGDCWFFRDDYRQALQVFKEARRCPKSAGNPFIHLRTGQCFYELGDKTAAADELTRAYMGAGREIFANEAPKYFELLKQVLKPPPGHTELL